MINNQFENKNVSYRLVSGKRGKSNLILNDYGEAVNLKLHENQTTLVQRSFDLSDEELFQLKIEGFINRLCKNNPVSNRLCIPACVDCGQSRLINKDTGKAVPIVMYCHSQYCDDSDCISNRKKLYRLQIGSFIKSQEESKIKKNTTKHIMLGFKRIHIRDFNYDFLKKCNKDFHDFLKDWKLMNPNNYLKGVAVLDLAFNKKDNTIFVHYHLGVRPYGNILNKNTLKELNDLGNSYNLKVVFKKGKTKTNALINYLAKRRSGLFGHKEKGSNFMLKDILGAEDYYRIFYKQKRFFSFGFSKSERKRIKLLQQSKVEELIESGELFKDSLSSNNIKHLLFKPVCECGCHAWRFVKYEDKGEPPPS